MLLVHLTHKSTAQMCKQLRRIQEALFWPKALGKKVVHQALRLPISVLSDLSILSKWRSSQVFNNLIHNQS